MSSSPRMFVPPLRTWMQEKNKKKKYQNAPCKEFYCTLEIFSDMISIIKFIFLFTWSMLFIDFCSTLLNFDCNKYVFSPN